MKGIVFSLMEQVIGQHHYRFTRVPVNQPMADRAGANEVQLNKRECGLEIRWQEIGGDPVPDKGRNIEIPQAGTLMSGDFEPMAMMGL